MAVEFFSWPNLHDLKNVRRSWGSNTRPSAFAFADILVCPQLWGFSPVECETENIGEEWKKMSWNRENWERQKEEKMEKDKEIGDILWINWVLSARSSRPESWRCRATLQGRYDLEVGSTILLSWERKRSVYSLCLLSTYGIDVLFFQYLFSNRTLHQWQQGDVVS